MIEGRESKYHENLKMGKFVDIGIFTYISAKYEVRIIEDDALAGSYCPI